MEWFYDDDFDYAAAYKKTPGEDDWSLESFTSNASCHHDWKPTLLIFSTVYDCKKCGKKKEEL